MADRPLTRRDVLRAVGAGVGTAIGAGSGAAAADHDEEPDAFAGEDAPSCDAARTDDGALPFDTDGAYGGWGGHEYHGTEDGDEHDRCPVVFVHGNADDACAFDPHAAAFLDRGYAGDALWSITFREETSTHEAMRDQLDGFVDQVLDHTGAGAIDVVAHSLGVTGARFWLAERDRYDVVETFVGLGGANHGTWVCGPGCEPLPGPGEPCRFLSPDCAEPEGPLWDLNAPDETPGDVDYHTVRGGLDAFFLHDRESPALEGAENVELPWTGHDGVRESDASIRSTYEWVR